MNRTTVLLLALALLLAHAMAIYHDPQGGYGPPCDQAHVLYAQARGWIHADEHFASASWAAQPAPLWFGLAALAERLSWFPTTLCQSASMLFALGALALLALFSRTRLAGVVAPLLIAVNGAMATAAGDGTEASLQLFLWLGAFLAFQRRSSGWLAAALALLVLCKPEATVHALELLALELVRRANPQQPRLRLGLAFGPAFALEALRALLRVRAGQDWLQPELALLAHPDAQRLAVGGSYVLDQVRVLGSPLLLALPAVVLVRRRLSRLGTEALALSLLEAARIAVAGGSDRPFALALLPALPLAFLAVQESVIAIIDRSRPALEALLWVLLCAGAGWSALASKLPGNIGPFPTQQGFEAWVAPSARDGWAYNRLLGRRGLESEIKDTQRLRALGLFLRDRVRANTQVLSPWPGALAYLSSQPTLDLFERSASWTPERARRASIGPQRADCVAALGLGADYAIPWVADYDSPRTLDEVARLWLERFDSAGNQSGRAAALAQALSAYELIAVPLPRAEGMNGMAGVIAPLLRKRALGLGPALELELRGNQLLVWLRHVGPPQVADLRVTLRTAAGLERVLLPSGEFADEPGAVARTELLLFPTGTQPVRVLATRLPDSLEAGQLRAELHNPHVANARGTAALCAHEIPWRASLR